MRTPSSLRTWLLALIFLASLPGAGLEFYHLARFRSEAMSAAKEELAALTRGVVAEQSAVTAAARQLLLALASLPEIKGADPGEAACRSVLNGIARAEGIFTNLGVIDPDGKVHCTTLASAATVNASDRTYFQRALRKRGFAAGDYQIGRVTGRGSINYALPILADDGTVRKVIFASFRLSSLLQSSGILDALQRGRLTLLDTAFNVVARFPRDERVGKNIAGTEMHALLLRGGPEGTGSAVGFSGERRIHAFTAVRRKGGETQGYIVFSVPEAHVLAAANRTLMWELSTVLIFFAATAVIAVAGINVLVMRRLQPLVEATRKLAGGDFGARVPAGEYPNEFSVLANAFNDMAARIEIGVDRIARLNRVYAVLTEINGAILRFRDTQALAAEACRIAVETGGFLAACIYTVDKDAKRARLRAHAGAGAGHFKELLVDIHEAVSPRNGPVSRSLKTGSYAIEQDLIASPDREWVSRVHGFGCRAIGSFPLVVEGQRAGALALFSSRPDAFDQEEVQLLLQLAADTALGLEHIDRQTRLYQLSNFDVLTGLPNRSLFEDRVTQILARAPHRERMAAVLLLRVGRLPQIGDTFGRAATDEMLGQVARYLNEAVRPGDTIARLGDREFGVLLADVGNSDDIVATANRLISKYPRSIAWAGHSLVTHIDMGVASFPDDGRSAESLIRNAQLALDSISKGPGNRFAFYSGELDRKARERHDIESELSGAIERGELSAVYQPIVNVRDRTIVGAEALVRWKNRLLGQVSPAIFVPVAEQIGQIIGIGAWVFEAACEQRLAWARLVTQDFRLSVNVSVYQLRHPGFLTEITQIMERTGLDSHELGFGIEITESEVIDDIDRTVPVLRDLREKGIYLSIDDFGTGYSSLSYLRRLPVDAVKIDVSFVREITTDPDAKIVAAGILALSQGLNLRAVAEGVETEEQLKLLDASGCHAAQGYLFSRPLPPADFMHLLAASR